MSAAEFSKCHHPSCVDKVTGEHGAYCSIMRSFSCGESARFFKSRIPNPTKEKKSFDWIGLLKWFWEK